MHLFYYLVLLELALAITYYSNILQCFFNIKDVRYSQTCYRQNIYLIIAFFILFVFHGFRDPTGLFDVPQYVSAYKEALSYSMERVINDGYIDLDSEIGFRILIKMVSYLSHSYTLLFILTSAIIIYSFYHATEKYSNIYWFSVLIFLADHFAQSLFILRAFFAIAILLFSFPYIIERKLLPYLILCTLAFTVHISSIIFFPIYFLYGIKNEKLLTTLLLLCSVISLLSFEEIVFWLVEKIFPGYSYYLVYLDNYEGANWKMPLLLFAILMLRICVLRKHFFDIGITRLLSILSVLSFVIYTSGMGFGLTSRMAMYFTNMQFLVLPDTVYRVKSQVIKYAVAISYIVLIVFFFLKSSTDDYYCNYRLISLF